MGNGLEIKRLDAISCRLLAEMTEEDVPENCREFVKILGLDFLAELIYNLGGLQMYFPKFESLPQLLGIGSF